MSQPVNAPGAARGKWMALTAALLGWMFDGAEMGLFSMVGRPAITDLLTRSNGAVPTEKEVGLAFSVVIAMFLVGAATGGVLFGWLGDRIGRVRAMTLSVLTYALFTGLCGICTNAWQVAILRFIAALGMGGEWSLGVALVMEVWPNRSRALMAGLIGAAANVGYFFVGLIGVGLASILHSLQETMLQMGVSPETAKFLVDHQGWRIMMILGAAPALLTFLIRMFVPESEKWEHEHGKGSTSFWSSYDLLGVLVGALGPALIIYVWSQESFPLDLATKKLAVTRAAVTLTGIVIATIGYLFPVIRYLQRQRAGLGVAAVDSGSTIRRMLLGASLSGVALLGTWASAQWASAWAGKLVIEGRVVESAADLWLTNPKFAKEMTLMFASLGAILGTIVAALAGDALGRRVTYSLMCLLGFGSTLLFYLGNQQFGLQFLVCAFLLGACTASFYGWLPLYLPELFRTAVRATGQGFAFNYGRILAAIGALQAGVLTGFIKEPWNLGGVVTLPPGMPGACSLMSLVYAVGLILIWFAPETKGQPLPE